MNADLWDEHVRVTKLKAEVRRLRSSVSKQKARAELWKHRALRKAEKK